MTAQIRYSLADLYDADLRSKDQVARDLASLVSIPHPLRNVQYADGMRSCTHAKRHQRFDYCPGGKGAWDLPLHRTEVSSYAVATCGTCDGGGCPDCTDSAYDGL